MLTRWGDFDRAFQFLDDVRRELDHSYLAESHGNAPRAVARVPQEDLWPRISVMDAGAQLVLKADVPGVNDKDLHIGVDDGVLTIAGERKVEVPEGYTVHRQERSGFKFTRNLALPCKVDVEKSIATLRDGVLTLELPKAPDAQPRRIAIRN